MICRNPITQRPPLAAGIFDVVLPLHPLAACAKSAQSYPQHRIPHVPNVSPLFGIELVCSTMLSRLWEFLRVPSAAALSCCVSPKHPAIDKYVQISAPSNLHNAETIPPPWQLAASSCAICRGARFQAFRQLKQTATPLPPSPIRRLLQRNRNLPPVLREIYPPRLFQLPQQRLDPRRWQFSQEARITSIENAGNAGQVRVACFASRRFATLFCAR